MADRICSRCHEPKPATIEFFRPDKGGLRARCRVCEAIVDHARYTKDPEGWKEKARQWLDAHPGKKSEYASRFYVNNKEEILAHGQQWRDQNKDKE